MSNSRRFQRGLLVLALCPFALAISPPRFLSERFRGRPVEVREVEGIQDRVHDGKLYLHLKDFISLVLKNNTEINLARLDVLTAADAILNAKAPFDPNLKTSFSSLRANSPQFSQIGGAERLDQLIQHSELRYQQTDRK